ncbi:MAG TPA: aminoglycoside phosphotransferase family protein [Thermoplasmata archaeon]|nr:aminoglycoside phosphotransferase family protein [Thermoplasmata archaeon]
MVKGAPLAVGHTAEIFVWGEGRVVKLIRPDFPPNLADQEAEILRRARAAGLPVPDVDTVVEVEGRRGIVLERIDAPSMLDLLVSNMGTGERWARVLAEVHANIHRLTVPDPPSQRDRLERVIRAGDSLDAGAKQAVLSALERLPDGHAICHGDLHPGNVLITSRGPVVIDWIDATVGNPIGDVGWTLLLLEIGKPPLGLRKRLRLELVRSAFQRAYLHRYRELRSVSLEDLAAWRLPIAAARLEEHVPGERPHLLSMVASSV